MRSPWRKKRARGLTRRVSDWRDVATVLSLIVALAGITGTMYSQWEAGRREIALKEYEVTFIEKQRLYMTFMQQMNTAFYSAMEENRWEYRSNVDRLETVFYGLEPFLGPEESESIKDQLDQFQAFCYRVMDEKMMQGPKQDKALDSFVTYRKYFRYKLFLSLFGKSHR
jgi:hypothetical protein